MINIILAFDQPLPDRIDGDGSTVTPGEWLPMEYGGSWVRVAWREPVVATKRLYVFDVLLPDEEAMDRIAKDYPDAIVIGVWDSGKGDQKRALSDKALDVMPDTKEGRRPSAARDYHRWGGMAPRDWSVK